MTTGLYSQTVLSGQPGLSVTTGLYSQAVLSGQPGLSGTTGLYSQTVLAGQPGLSVTTGLYSQTVLTESVPSQCFPEQIISLSPCTVCLETNNIEVYLDVLWCLSDR